MWGEIYEYLIAFFFYGKKKPSLGKDQVWKYHPLPPMVTLRQVAPSTLGACSWLRPLWSWYSLPQSHKFQGASSTDICVSSWCTRNPILSWKSSELISSTWCPKYVPVHVQSWGIWEHLRTVRSTFHRTTLQCCLLIGTKYPKFPVHALIAGRCSVRERNLESNPGQYWLGCPGGWSKLAKLKSITNLRCSPIYYCMLYSLSICSFCYSEMVYNIKQITRLFRTQWLSQDVFCGSITR